MKTILTAGRAILISMIAITFFESCKKDTSLAPEEPKVDLQDESLMNHLTDPASVKVSTLATEIPLGWIAADLRNGNLYVSSGSAVLKISQTGAVSTLAGNPSESGYRNGTGTAARFSGLQGITVKDGNIYVCDSRNHVIRKITASGVVSTYAGTGTAGYVNRSRLSSKFNTPLQITNRYGSFYVFDRGNARIRKISSDGTVRSFVGTGVLGVTDGKASQAQVEAVSGMVVDKDNNLIFVEHNEGTIRRVRDGYVRTIVRVLNSSGLANFALPQGLTISSGGALYVADSESNSIKKVTRTSSGYRVSTVAGSTEGFEDGTGATAKFYYPQGITWYNNKIFVLEQNRAVRKISLP